MAKYTLVGGGHVDEDGKPYKRGDTVTSDKDLIKLFPNKFERYISAAQLKEMELAEARKLVAEAEAADAKADAAKKKTPVGKGK